MRMRCPNPACRQVFEVEAYAQPVESSGKPSQVYPDALPADAEEPGQPNVNAPRGAGSVGEFVTVLEAEVVDENPPPKESNSTRGGKSVGDEVPLVEAEAVEETDQAEPRRPASWRQPPPVRKASPGPRPAPAAAPEPAEDKAPSWLTPPPVRRGTGDGSSDFAPPDGGGPPVHVFEADTLPPAPGTVPVPAPTRAARRTLLAFFIMLLAGGLVIGSVVAVVLNRLVRQEGILFQEANQEYSDARYAAAAKAFDDLSARFPKSDKIPHYQSLAELSRTRDLVYTSQPVSGLDRLNEFVKKHKDGPIVKEHQSDIEQTYRKLAEELTTLAKDKGDRATLAKARAALAESQNFKSGEQQSADDKALVAQMDEAEQVIVKAEKRQQALDRIGRLVAENQPTAETVRQARDQVEREGLQNDAEANRLITQLEDAVRSQVRYVDKPAGPSPPAAEPAEPSLILSPAVGGFASNPRENKRIVLALVRGVLYGLDQGTGQVRWVTRVGVDTTTLPVRLPASPTSPELFLVVSAAQNSVMTLVAQTGQVYWKHKLSAPCLGRPVIVEPWAYVPTYDGRVHEIETVQGNLQGYFDLGQPLTVGGVWQEGTDLVYFPGDSDNVYVLDIARKSGAGKPARKKRCLNILHTGHPSGSLRSEPIIVTRSDPSRNPEAQASWPPYLILSQSDGLNHMKLRVFGLPIENPDVPPLLQPEPRITGWSWFQPYHDIEKLAFVTDRGVLGLFGINQVRNEDKPIFPQFTEEQKPLEDTGLLGRAQVVHALENDYWVLVNGQLQRQHFDLFGQRLTPLWQAPLSLGSPLHAAQVDDNGKTLFVVTQDLSGQVCLATAVDAERGKILWQRQLGIGCQGDPLVVSGQVLVRDPGSGLFAFDGKRERLEPGQDTWWKAEPLRLGNAAPGASHLFVAQDGNALYELSSPEKSTALTVRKYRRGDEREPSLMLEKEKTVNLPAPLAGRPAVGEHYILLPLADGSMQRLPLPLNGDALAGGPDWRSGRADDGARCHVVFVAAEEFLATDGSRGLTHFRWPANDTFSTVPKNRDITADLPARIVAAPVVLPRPSPDAELRVCVADADNNVTLLGGPELKTERVWSMGGEITAGPFLRGQHLGCVVDRRLVWIDPARDQPLWRYTMAGEGIVGEPQVIGDLLVVADVSGRFVGIDPVTGKPRNLLGYMLKAHAAPVATPVVFGKNEAFVPLTDGTVFILSLDALRKPVGIPSFIP